MEILRGIIKTAKDLYNADSNNQLDKYIGEKVSNIVKKIDGTETAEFQNYKERRLEEIQELLNTEPFENEFYQDVVDIWLEECAQSESDSILAYYLKYRGWENVFYSIGETRQEDGYWDKPDEEKEAFDEKEKEANTQCLEYLQKAIDLLDEDSAEMWICTLSTAKAERLHWMGNHVEAVRLAIIALPYACDENEKERAKASITGMVAQGLDTVYLAGGYGIDGRTTKELIERIEESNAFEYDNDSSIEENKEMMELCAECLPAEIDSFIHGQTRFSNRPYHDRQFIFTVRDLDHIGGCYDETDTIKYVFPLNELPKDITFPVGHPQANTLYYAHPLRPMYLPFENAQILLFYEKVHEMCRLFQCLGATQITARCLKGKKISQDILTSYDANVEGGYKIVNGSAGVSGKNTRLENKENQDEMLLNQTFSPQKAPYCPNDLVWAKEDPELRTLIQQRLEGGLLEFTKKVSSYETSNLSQNQINDVKAAFQSLMANVSANYSASMDSTFSQTTETEWEISVQFKPLDEFQDYVSPQEQKAIADARKGNLIMEVSQFFFTKEKGIVILDTLQTDIKVGEQVIVCNNDSEFDSSIEGIVMFFKMLPEAESGDKVGLILNGVTATNIQCGTRIYQKRETSCSDKKNAPQEITPTNQTTLTPEEEKYKEEILFCLEESGTITDDDRKYLERKRKRFGISEERAKEIEQQIAPSLKENEREYLETYKELTSSGTLTDRIKRLLERERESLNISKERAAEIEKLVITN